LSALQQVKYDLCVMTGDFRAKTFGDYHAALAALAQVRDALHGPIYAVLGNHDSIRMTPGIEALGITILLNEAVALELDGEVIHLAGIDDPHYFQVDNFDKAAQHIPPDATAILLSHSPEPYQRAAHAGFDLMLSGHTHGGQVLPARRDGPDDQCGLPTPFLQGRLALPCHAGLYLSGIGRFSGRGAFQLPAGNYPASSANRIRAGSIGPVTNTDPVEDR
jgi:predicted phosphodiesterase